jgi:hypothetical protein
MNNNEPILTYENITDQFLKSFPEFKEKAEEDRKYWMDETDEGEVPLDYLFFGEVLNVYLMEEGLVKVDNPQLLKRLFEFMEKMALSDDGSVIDLLRAGILEHIGDDKELLKRARTLMGEKTLKMSHEVEKGWGREEPSQPEFLKEIEAAIQELKAELEKRKNGIDGDGTVFQLESFIKELIWLYNDIKIDNLPPKKQRDLSLAWFITNVWRDDSPLGRKLTSIIKKYKFDLD